MEKNTKIGIGIALGVLVIGGIAYGVHVSNRRKREEQARQEEYWRSMQNTQGMAGVNQVNPMNQQGNGLVNLVSGLTTLWNNRKPKDDPRDVAPIATTPITKIDNKPTVAAPDWGLSFDGGSNYVEVGSELDDLN